MFLKKYILVSIISLVLIVFYFFIGFGTIFTIVKTLCSKTLCSKV